MNSQQQQQFFGCGASPCYCCYWLKHLILKNKEEDAKERICSKGWMMKTREYETGGGRAV
jgi:hypothetical protein